MKTILIDKPAKLGEKEQEFILSNFHSYYIIPNKLTGKRKFWRMFDLNEYNRQARRRLGQQ